MTLSFHQQLLLTLVDKLIIAGALVLVGFWLNRRLEGFKSTEAARLQISAQIAAARLPAYQKLWEI
jgi:flagellar biogenesis protein FliO